MKKETKKQVLRRPAIFVIKPHKNSSINKKAC